MNAILALDIVALVSFSAAAAAALMLPVGLRSIVTPSTRWIVFAAMAIYVAIAFGELLRDQAIVGDIRILIDYVEVLFVPLVLYALHSLQMTLDMQRQKQQAEAFRAQHEMVMRIIEATPAGIAVLDDVGRITFANERAIALLSLKQDAETGAFRCPECDVVQPARTAPEAPRNLFSHLVDKAAERLVHILRWPDGRTQVLAVSSTPIENDGAVIAFDEAGSWIRRPPRRG